MGTVRLINSNTRRLEEFPEGKVPPYAILSHRWGPDDEEISFQEALSGEIVKVGPGRDKFDGCRSQAARDGFEYVWIDTCCIDKSSSTELSEAINSIFRWYKDAGCCYAYLSDVPSGDDAFEPHSRLGQSCWFQRGWTLQELLAPNTVQFYSSKWGLLGSKRDLWRALVQITKIPRSYLLGFTELHEASIAQRMSWAAGRTTKRTEDMAYCLLGIFNVYMPLIYGQGDRAFIRLQEEIIKETRDDSILAWDFPEGQNCSTPVQQVSGGVLSSSPLYFAGKDNTILVRPAGEFDGSLQGVGDSVLLKRHIHTNEVGQDFVVLQCRPEERPGHCVGIPIKAKVGSDRDYMRLRGAQSIVLQLAKAQTQREIRIRISRTEDDDDSGFHHSFYIENFLENELKLTDVFPAQTWIRDKDIIMPDHNTTSRRFQRIWTRFSHQNGDGKDFIVILERIWWQAEA
ncbi:heterokaryon incompatibility protein-domain-containing protein [Xylariaceae sp. FL0016]|nr:heterokaryon incompatibility protein-domain-containing protein [Xylariaceae sp. FL0016]